MNINIDEIRSYSGRIAIVGHGCADFDAMTSGLLLEYVFNTMGIEAHFTLPDGKPDEYFVPKAVELGLNFLSLYRYGLSPDAAVFLVDHTADYPNEVIGCIDHHPAIVEISRNYTNQPQTCCAKIIYDWACEMGVLIPIPLTKLVVYACHMDSLSFKSTKALPEDRVWCRKMIQKFGMDEQEVINFGYVITDRNQDYDTYLQTGLKSYDLGNGKVLKASYAVAVDDEDDLDKAAEHFRTKLDGKTIAWCYLIQNPADDKTKVLLVTDEEHFIQSVDKVLSRGKDVIPAAMEFLNETWVKDHN